MGWAPVLTLNVTPRRDAAAEKPFGYVFLDCTLTGTGAKAYLGRPWRPHGAVAFIRQ